MTKKESEALKAKSIAFWKGQINADDLDGLEGLCDAYFYNDPRDPSEAELRKRIPGLGITYREWRHARYEALRNRLKAIGAL